MAPINPTTTLRIRAHYSGPYGDHTMLFHGIAGATLTELVSDVADFASLVGPLQFQGTSWSTAEYANPGSTLFLPVPGWVAINDSSTNDAGPNDSPSRFLNWVGRDTSVGTRVKLYLFETYATAKSDMRWNAGESTAVDAVTDLLNNEASKIGNIAGRIPVWNDYANVGENDYLTHKARH